MKAADKFKVFIDGLVDGDFSGYFVRLASLASDTDSHSVRVLVGKLCDYPKERSTPLVTWCSGFLDVLKQLKSHGLIMPEQISATFILNNLERSDKRYSRAIKDFYRDTSKSKFTTQEVMLEMGKRALELNDTLGSAARAPKTDANPRAALNANRQGGRGGGGNNRSGRQPTQDCINHLIHKKCKYGDRCFRNHDKKRLVDPDFFKKHADKTNAQQGNNDRQDSSTPAAPKTPKIGGRDAPPPMREPTSILKNKKCQYWVKGQKCPFEDRPEGCKYLHKEEGEKSGNTARLIDIQVREKRAGVPKTKIVADPMFYWPRTKYMQEDNITPRVHRSRKYVKSDSQPGVTNFSGQSRGDSRDSQFEKLLDPGEKHVRIPKFSEVAERGALRSGSRLEKGTYIHPLHLYTIGELRLARIITYAA